MLEQAKTTTLISLLLLLAVVSLGACNSDSNPSEPSGGGSSVIDVGGDWSIAGDVDGTACGDGTYQENYTATIVQTGSVLVVTTPFAVFTGSINGTAINWSGAYDDSEGTNSIDATSLSVSSDGATLIGSISWTFAPFGGGASCSGTTNVMGTAIPETNQGVTGTWQINEDVNAGSCLFADYSDSYSIDIVQNGTAITVTAPAGTFQGTLIGTTLQWTGSYPDDGGTVRVTMSITVNGDSTSLSGNSNWIWTDGASDTCAGTTTVTGTKN